MIRMMKHKPGKIKIILALAFAIYFLVNSNYLLFDNLQEADFFRSQPVYEVPELVNFLAFSKNQLLSIIIYPLVFIFLHRFSLQISQFCFFLPHSLKKAFFLRC